MHPTITEARLRTAAQRAVAGGHALAAILFGSRARGTAGALSDWDVCLVTEEAPGDELARSRALEAEDPLWDDGRIETLWLARARFDRGVSAGTLEAAIAHEGRALAGDTTVTTRARTVPFEAETVHRNLGRASEHLVGGIGAARRHARTKHEGKRGDLAVKMLTESIAGAEALARALCALTETEHTGDHRIARNGRRIGERADEANPPLKGALMRAISERVQQLNDTAQAVRKAEYGEPGEEHEKTVDRFALALETDLAIRQGLIEGTGAWAGLRNHPRRGELAKELAERTAADTVENAREWKLAPVELADEKLRVAMHRWVNGYQALRVGHLERARASARTRAD